MTKMTKKDYILIALAIRGIDEEHVRIKAARVLAFALREDNKRFDIMRFIEACRGVKEDGT
jgi:hypothetical protein